MRVALLTSRCVSRLFYCGNIRHLGARPFSLTAGIHRLQPQSRLSRLQLAHSRVIAKMNTQNMSTQVEKVTDNLEKPELDDRSYRVIRLPNKLEALLVHDPDTDKASASVNVKVGSFSDAVDMPGMAHAVEHLLFMGTRKFPVENEYSQYLSSHSGYSNAYTAGTETNYYFEVAASAEDDTAQVKSQQKEPPLYGALDRFSQFFISPLFLAETLDRELRAVDSENKKNLQSDLWRLKQLKMSTSNPNHPYSHFSTGNLTTLRDDPQKRGVEIRDAFIDFHDRHYSANRMKLVILGKENLDTLEAWTSELFSAVPNKDLDDNRWDGVPLLRDAELLTQRFAKPVMDTRSLEISFMYQDEEDLFEVQPGHYISHLIGHEGPGSVLSYIKDKGWATELTSGASPACPGAALFNVSIRLTEEGLANYQEIVKVVFQYIALIKETPPQQWIVEEMKGLAEVDFRFKQKTPASSFTSGMSSTMQKRLPREWLLSGQRLIRRFDAAAIKTALDCITPESYRLAIVSQKFPGGWDKKEKWYGTDYKIDKIPENLLKEFKKAMTSGPADRIPDLHLPHKNEFIPTNLHVEKKDIDTPAKVPKLIRNDESVRLWWKKDDTFWVPKATFSISLHSPRASVTPADMVKAALFVDLVNDALVEYSYDAELAGLGYYLTNGSRGLIIEVRGYNDKMHVLLDKLLHTIRSLEVKPDRFKIVKEKLERAYSNWQYSQPYNQVSVYSTSLKREHSWTPQELLAAASPITDIDIQQYYPQLLEQGFLEILAQGNLYKEDVLRMTAMTETILKPRIFPVSQRQVRRDLLVPFGDEYTWKKTLTDPAQLNNCIEYSLYVGSLINDRLRATALLYAQLSEEQAFDQLRTKEQLGYIVWSGARSTANSIAYRVIVQSERTCDYLEARINAFLALTGRTIRDMSASDFEGHRRSIINKRLEKPKNLDAEINRFAHHIDTGNYHFRQVDADVEQLRQLSKQELLDFFDRYISPASTTRSKLSVHMDAHTSVTETAKILSPEQQKEMLVSAVAKYITSTGVNVDEDKFIARFKSVDISKGDVTSILAAARSYLVEDAHQAADNVQKVLDDGGRKLVTTALPGLGIEVAADKDNAGEALPEAPATARPSAVIEDVAAWKASLELSAGPRPVVELSSFADTDAKL